MGQAARSPVIDTPLAARHREAEAKMGAWFGCALPDNFGDWREEYRYARETVGLVDKNYRSYISLTGPDRVRYLHAILTNSIKDLEPGRGIVALLLNPQGHMLAEIETHAEADRLLCISYAMSRDTLVPALQKYIIMDDVTLTDDTEKYATLGLEGPKAAAVVKELTLVNLGEMAELESKRVPLGQISCHVLRRSPGADTGAEFLIERDHLPALWRALEAAARKNGGGPTGYTALNALRLEQGVPWFGYDFGEKQIPHEARLENSHLSFTKGCYTGQEIVERVRSRGQVNRLRTLLKLDGETLPFSGAGLLAEGKDVGYVTRSGYSPALGCAIAMGYVRRENSAVGDRLDCGGMAATIIEPPLARH